MAAARSLEERVAVLENDVVDLDREVERTRGRLHDIEPAVRLTDERLKYLARSFDQAKADLNALRDELGSFRKTMVGFAFTVALSAIGVALTVLIGTGNL